MCEENAYTTSKSKKEKEREREEGRRVLSKRKVYLTQNDTVVRGNFLYIHIYFPDEKIPKGAVTLQQDNKQAARDTTSTAPRISIFFLFYSIVRGGSRFGFVSHRSAREYVLALFLNKKHTIHKRTCC